MSDYQPRILAFAGSTRSDSLHKKLAQAAADGAAAAGAAVTVIDLQDYPLPLFDEDLEAAEGLPENAAKLREVFMAHDGLLIASPEYNGSLSAVLKNMIDWLSRRQGDEAPLICFKEKVALLLAASPGGLGGLRGLRHLNTILHGLQVIVLPEQKAIPGAFALFDDKGITDEKLQGDVAR
ncbi:MAG: NAD(P)H-dependent oxidoreductase, partial [Candidatus Hydrogenedentes bacterium]|nr:NAD(P)H-dependent oxidoreductase [Candidatus Hydrogenedentota bacterium]